MACRPPGYHPQSNSRLQSCQQRPARGHYKQTLTPLIFGIPSRVRGGGVSLDGVGLVFCELLLPFFAGHLLRRWIGGWVENNRGVLSVTDRGSILLVVYAAFSAAVEHGVWHQLSPNVLFPLALIVAFVLATILLTIKFASSAMDFGHQDEIAAMFCGSQKSLVSGVPIASALFSGPAVGPILIPIMFYYPVQIVVCAWLARRYAATSDAVTGLAAQTHHEVASVGNGGPPKSYKPRTGEISRVFRMGFRTLARAGQRSSRPSATQHRVER